VMKRPTLSNMMLSSQTRVRLQAPNDFQRYPPPVLWRSGSRCDWVKTPFLGHLGFAVLTR